MIQGLVLLAMLSLLPSFSGSLWASGLPSDKAIQAALKFNISQCLRESGKKHDSKELFTGKKKRHKACWAEEDQRRYIVDVVSNYLEIAIKSGQYTTALELAKKMGSGEKEVRKAAFRCAVESYKESILNHTRNEVARRIVRATEFNVTLEKIKKTGNSMIVAELRPEEFVDFKTNPDIWTGDGLSDSEVLYGVILKFVEVDVRRVTFSLAVQDAAEILKTQGIALNNEKVLLRLADNLLTIAFFSQHEVKPQAIQGVKDVERYFPGTFNVLTKMAREQDKTKSVALIDRIRKQ